MDYLLNLIPYSNIKRFTTGTMYRSLQLYNSEENMNWVYNALTLFKSMAESVGETHIG
jgi:hypothetical protein